MPSLAKLHRFLVEGRAQDVSLARQLYTRGGGKGGLVFIAWVNCVMNYVIVSITIIKKPTPNYPYKNLTFDGLTKCFSRSPAQIEERTYCQIDQEEG